MGVFKLMGNYADSFLERTLFRGTWIRSLLLWIRHSNSDSNSDSDVVRNKDINYKTLKNFMLRQ